MVGSHFSEILLRTPFTADEIAARPESGGSCDLIDQKPNGVAAGLGETRASSLIDGPTVGRHSSSPQRSAVRRASVRLRTPILE